MMKNKKSILIVILLVLLLTEIVLAQTIGNSFRNGLVSINNFFANESYRAFSKVIDFVIFSVLFLSLFTLGAKKVFSEYTRPVQIIVVTFGLVLSFVFVIANISIANLIPYAWYLFYIFSFIFLYWLLGKFGMESKFWKFLLALLILLLIIALIAGMLSVPRPSDIQRPDIDFDTPDTGPVRRFFESFGGMFGRIEGVEGPGLPGWLSELFEPIGAGEETTAPTRTAQPTTTRTTTPGDGGTAQTAQSDQGRGLSGWIWLIFLWALAASGLGGAIAGGIYLRNKWKGRDGPTTRQPQPPPVTQIDTIKSKITELSEKKLDILGKIKAVNEDRAHEIGDFSRICKEKITELAFVLDPSKTEHENVAEEDHDVEKLLKYERRLEKELAHLKEFEDEFVNSLNDYQNIVLPLIRQETSLPEQQRQNQEKIFVYNIDQLFKTIQKIKLLVGRYFHIDLQEQAILANLENLIDLDTLEKEISQKWGKLKERDEAGLLLFFNNEKILLNSLSIGVKRQNSIILWILEFLNWFQQRAAARESATEAERARAQSQLQTEPSYVAITGPPTGSSSRSDQDITFKAEIRNIRNPDGKRYEYTWFKARNVTGDAPPAGEAFWEGTSSGFIEDVIPTSELYGGPQFVWVEVNQIIPGKDIISLPVQIQREEPVLE